MITKKEAQKVKEIFDRYFDAAYDPTDPTLYVVEYYSHTEDYSFKIMSAYTYMTRIFDEFLKFDFRDVNELEKNFNPYTFLENMAIEFTTHVTLVTISNSHAGYAKPIMLYNEDKDNEYLGEDTLYMLFRRTPDGRLLHYEMGDSDFMNLYYAGIMNPIKQLDNSLKELFQVRINDTISNADKALKLIRKVNTMKLEDCPDLVDILSEAIKDYENKEE